MKTLSGKGFSKIIEKHGLILMRVSGSLHIYGKPNSVVRLSGNNPLKIGLPKHLMRMAGLDEEDLD